MKIALIAHDDRKDKIVDLAKRFRQKLSEHSLFATGSTGNRIMAATGLEIHCFKSGPVGGDQQIGARISEHKMDMVIFLRDPLTAQPHEPDVNALIRLCDVYEVPLATNFGTAEILLRSL